MFRFLAKSALVVAVWKRYRRTILSTLALFICYFLVSLFHGDYVEYAASAGDKDFLWRSYLIKWAVLIGVTAIYYLYNTRILIKRRANALPPSTGKTRERIVENPPQSDGESDPFAEIRRKERLQSRGDIALDRNNRSD